MRLLAATIVGCVVVALVVAGLALRPPTDAQPANPLIVDWRKGTYEGVAVRDRTRRLLVRLGQPVSRGTNEPASPAGEDYYEIGGPTSFGSPGDEYSKDDTLRYERRSFFASDGRIYGWVTTSPRAQTPEGVGVGDSRDLVSKRYPDAECGTGNEGSGYITFPLCEIRACNGRRLAFGGDPIKSVWLVAETILGWERCFKPAKTTPRADA